MSHMDRIAFYRDDISVKIIISMVENMPSNPFDQIPDPDWRRAKIPNVKLYWNGHTEVSKRTMGFGDEMYFCEVVCIFFFLFILQREKYWLLLLLCCERIFFAGVLLWWLRGFFFQMIFFSNFAIHFCCFWIMHFIHCIMIHPMDCIRLILSVQRHYRMKIHKDLPKLFKSLHFGP